MNGNASSKGYIAMTLGKGESSPFKNYTFFYMKNEPKIDDSLHGSRMVKATGVPSIYDIRGEQRELGNIKYQLCRYGGQLIEKSNDYDPKKTARTVRGLGYYLEWLAVDHLQKLGTKFIMTTHLAELPRHRQLYAVDLKKGTATPIEVWKHGLTLGILFILHEQLGKLTDAEKAKQEQIKNYFLSHETVCLEVL